MMNDRERRDFNAGLSEDVDAWLRGDTSRRSFLTKMMLMGGAAMVPGLGFTAAGSVSVRRSTARSPRRAQDPRSRARARAAR